MDRRNFENGLEAAFAILKEENFDTAFAEKEDSELNESDLVAARTAAEYIDKYISGNIDEFKDRIQTTPDKVFVSCGEKALKDIVKTQFLDVLVALYGNESQRKLLRNILKKFPLGKVLELEGDDKKFDEIVELHQQIRNLQKQLYKEENKEFQWFDHPVNENFHVQERSISNQRQRKEIKEADYDRKYAMLRKDQEEAYEKHKKEFENEKAIIVEELKTKLNNAENEFQILIDSL